MRDLPFTDGVPLAQASLRLGMSRERVLRRVCTGALVGACDPSGRWWVSAKSLVRAERANPAERALARTAD